ncbi:MAG TPA: hypothetical protein VIS96_05210 [Terrimicrobiaceae bacterium]
MKTKNSSRRRHGFARMGPALLCACLLTSCEGGDVSLQSELAELRERVRRAEQERDDAKREQSRETERPSDVELQPVSTLQKNFEEAAKRLEQDVIATFPGYRPASIKRGKFAYFFDEQDPYRASVELSLRPNSASALTPQVPPIVFEARGTPDGEWKMPGQAALREMQAAASARAASQSQAGQRAQEPASSSQTPAHSSKGSDSRTVSWGDEQSSAPQKSSRDKDSPVAPATPSANTPRATESYEIRFND